MNLLFRRTTAVLALCLAVAALSCTSIRGRDFRLFADRHGRVMGMTPGATGAVVIESAPKKKPAPWLRQTGARGWLVRGSEKHEIRHGRLLIVDESGRTAEYEVERSVLARIARGWNMWKDNGDLLRRETRELPTLR